MDLLFFIKGQCLVLGGGPIQMWKGNKAQPHSQSKNDDVQQWGQTTGGGESNKPRAGSNMLHVTLWMRVLMCVSVWGLLGWKKRKCHIGMRLWIIYSCGAWSLSRNYKNERNACSSAFQIKYFLLPIMQAPSSATGSCIHEDVACPDKTWFTD